LPCASFARRGVTRWLALLLLACATPSPSPPALAPIWRDYLALKDERALAIAGDPRQGDRWVAGLAGGETTRQNAEAEALAACRTRRAARRFQAECVLYAVGTEIVWRGR
jgi:hypothetical protein